MLKKLLTLSLVAVMLSTVALAAPGLTEQVGTATYAEEPEEVTETIAVKNDDGTYNTEFLWVVQTTSDDSVSQSVTACTWSDSGKTSVVGYNKISSTVDRWTLARIKIGENWGTFSSLDLQMRVRALKLDNSVYSMPISKADYDAAAAAATNSTTLTSLVEPKTNDADATYQQLANRASTTSNGSYLTYTHTLGAEDFTGNCYQDGYLYFAFQAISLDNTTYENLGLDLYTSYWDFTVKGTKVEAPVVDDFSDAEVTYDNTTGAYTIATTTTTDEAYLIIASFTETTMNDVELVTVNAATASRNEDGAISGTITPLDEGTIKIFLWDKATLAPATPVQ